MKVSFRKRDGEVMNVTIFSYERGGGSCLGKPLYSLLSISRIWSIFWSMRTMRRKSSHNWQGLVIIAVVATCLAFLGMRPPNLSPPQVPKPTHRAVVEFSAKSVNQSVCKDLVSGEFVCNALTLVFPQVSTLSVHYSHPPSPAVAVSCIFSRAPPRLIV